MTLKSFPRGGRKPQDNLHSNEKSEKKSRSKSKYGKNDSVSPSYEDSHVTDLVAKSADCLNYNTLTQGMVVLGRVREAREYDLIVSLPGRLFGRLQLTDISESYTKLLESVVDVQDDNADSYKTLPEIFKPGDYLVVFVKQLNLTDKWRVSLSMEPELINQNLDRTRIIKRSRIIGSVASIEEHGYVIDTGVSNLRTFLAAKDIDEGKQYFIGQQLFLVVRDVETSDSASTIKVSAKAKHIAKASHDDQLLDALVPGTKLILTIKNILSDGLQLSFNKNNVGYANQIYLDGPPSAYSINTSVNGTLLYVLPTLKFAYFSLLSEEAKTHSLNVGDISTGATVSYKDRKGIVLKLPKGLKGYLPLRRTEVDFDKINSTFLPGTKHKLRILNYDWFDRVYICSMQKEILNQKHFTVSSFVPGELLNAEITKIDQQYGSVTLKIDTIRGYVPPEHVCDFESNKVNQLEIGQTVRARVLRTDSERNRVILTLKRSLIESNLPILSDINEATVGSEHHGTVVHIANNGVLIQFFGDLKGWVSPARLGCEIDQMGKKLVIGKVVTATILRVLKKQNRMKLSLGGETKRAQTKLHVGDTIEGIVIEASTQGVQVSIQNADEIDTEVGFLPAAHIAPSLEVASLLSARYTPGDKITATVFSTKPSVTLTKTFLPQTQFTNFDKLKIGSQLPCSVREITENGLRVLLPIEDFDDLGIVRYVKKSNLESIYVNQILFGKITSLNKKEREIELTTDLYKLWVDSVKKKSEMTNAVDTLGLHLNSIKELSQHDYYTCRPISKASLGKRVNGKIEKVTEHGLVLDLGNDLQGTVRKDQYDGQFKIGDEVSGAIIWINYIHEIVEVTLKPAVVDRIATEQTNLAPLPLSTQLRGEILLITNWFILVVLQGKGNGRIVALPARRHLNDIDPDLRPYLIGRKIKCFVILDSGESSLLPICILSSTLENLNLDLTTPIKKNSKKRKEDDPTKGDPPTKKTKSNKKNPGIEARLDGNDGTDETNNGNDQGSKNEKPVMEPKKKRTKKPKGEQTNVEVVEKTVEGKADEIVEKTVEPNEIGIPECGFYWDTEPTQQEQSIESSSDSDEDTESPQKPKKKKLSAAERRELERQKEREIREKEEALASNQMPNSVDQFDRLVMSSPDSSIVWVQYMAYHLQATEIEKARAVAKRGIKTINFREENERLNVWQAWLNLESRFGTLETLNETFQEAVRTNNAFKIYTHMLTLHADANRQTALEKTITTITGKFKENPQAWIECGTALLKIGLKDKSRNMMQRALQSLPAHQHVDLMVRFAQLENRYGDKERGQTLFEKVLSSYPKRVDVWSAYVDALIKSGDVPVARQVLERATAQTLPARKMKTLFKKFIAFEEQHGTPENIANVQQMARTYVENQCQ